VGVLVQFGFCYFLRQLLFNLIDSRLVRHLQLMSFLLKQIYCFTSQNIQLFDTENGLYFLTAIFTRNLLK